MSERDKFALGLGIILGIFSGVLSGLAPFYFGMFGFAVFIFFSIVSPLLVSVLAENRIMGFAQVPNLLMTLTGMIIFLALGGYSASVQLYGQATTLQGILIIIFMAVVAALIMSALVQLLRRKR